MHPLFRFHPGLSAGLCSDLSIAITAVHRPVVPRLERHLAVLAASGTLGGEHLALAVSAAFPRTALLLLGGAALGAPFRLVRVALLRVELLLLDGEGEVDAAVIAYEGLFLVGHG